MARTYGEIIESSFPEVFKIASGSDTVFIDIGSGHGKITIAAVQEYDCCYAVGIEKYREPQAVCDSHFKSLPEDIKQRLLFKLEDINDTDVLSILAKLNFQTLLIFCNNLAFTQGTLNRMAKKVLGVVEALPQKQVFLLSTVPLGLLQALFIRTVMLHMSWTAEPHESCLYASKQ